MAEQALRLTPQADVADARRRVFLAAEGHHVAGDGDRAIALLTNARADAAPGVDRATVLVELAAAHTDPHEAEALYNDALAEAEGNDALEAATHLRLAALMQWREGVERGLFHSEQAARAASSADDESHSGVVPGAGSNPPGVSEPPTVLGQEMVILVPAVGWYTRHFWVWSTNPSGISAHWSPDVTCP